MADSDWVSLHTNLLFGYHVSGFSLIHVAMAWERVADGMKALRLLRLRKANALACSTETMHVGIYALPVEVIQNIEGLLFMSAWEDCFDAANHCVCCDEELHQYSSTPNEEGQLEHNDCDNCNELEGERLDQITEWNSLVRHNAAASSFCLTDLTS